jgi:hypothetical protein
VWAKIISRGSIKGAGNPTPFIIRVSLTSIGRHKFFKNVLRPYSIAATVFGFVLEITNSSSFDFHAIPIPIYVIIIDTIGFSQFINA